MKGSELYEQLSGIWLSFEDREVDTIFRALKIYGFTPDSDGLKKYIMSRLLEDGHKKRDGNPLAEVAARWISENPEAVAGMYRNAAGVIDIMRKAVNKKSRG